MPGPQLCRPQKRKLQHHRLQGQAKGLDERRVTDPRGDYKLQHNLQSKCPQKVSKPIQQIGQLHLLQDPEDHQIQKRSGG